MKISFEKYNIPGRVSFRFSLDEVEPVTFVVCSFDAAGKLIDIGVHNTDMKNHDYRTFYYFFSKDVPEMEHTYFRKSNSVFNCYIHHCDGGKVAVDVGLPEEEIVNG